MKRRRHIPFREIAPNMVTSGNLLCGMLSLILAVHGSFVPAAWLIFAAVFFDFMDGKVARSLGGGSQFGLEFDSLADVVSFGVAPAVLLYVVFLKGFMGVSGALVASFFALCGALRLARFNVVHVTGHFQGIPIPAGGLFVASFVIAGVRLPPWVAMILLAAVGVLMISSVPYGNLKGIKKGQEDRKKFLFLFSLAVAIFVFFRSAGPLTAISIYVVSGLVGFDWGKWLSLPTDASGEDEAAEDHM